MSAFLEIRNLCVTLKSGAPILRNVSLSVAAGQVHGLVGESGAGKSMIGKAVLGTLPRALAVTRGEIWLDGVDLQTLRPAERRRRIGALAALIPQDPLTALNPARRIGPQITRRLVDILGWSRADAEARALELLAEVQIPDPARVMRSYPHELSGGMRQRILIAAAFAAEPKLIIADEPTTALDVTVQKQILRLIADMQTRHGTALLFVTHDLGVVSKVCDTLSVLYAGKVVEEAQMRRFFMHPIHPYSAALLAATPSYKDPEGSLTPVPQSVIDQVEREVTDHDRRAGL
ncbi:MULTISPECIES: ABC transporter ATP-binding protein [Sulfitobacter]|jgi:peptide/nickel transport system ATP-binding protein|uniref:D,D-dipeptide transport ATP-binding protein DdpD n=1 Tax=Sulfitobacter dubius TaxID=218673 RepID=A0ABY3ZVE4_9RHOB|nr:MULTISPECIES: ABC transporter ATP-binding protein [Sulfitobacter]UOA16763.1 putative D,D-dipeptide transport ATP-binding protein DdpD [Sulfitobacter dubius]UWR35540.1 ABC transporter ATP-binding protein [Sulfitobacter sp. W027]WOI30818.1 ABC transporter ATP-binding protein [Sulfitobacter dubius]